MSLENEKKVEVKTEEVKTETKVDEKSIAIDMAKIVGEQVREALKEQREVEVKEVPAKVIKSTQVKVLEDTRSCGKFKNIAEAHNYAVEFVPKNVLEQFRNTKALTTYQNIATDADGGSFDPIQAQGVLADSVERFRSYEEDTLQVKLFNSVGTFIDHTSDATAYMIGENTAGTESKPGNTTRTITQKKIMVLSPVTNEVLRFGSLADVANATLDSMGRAIALKKQHLIFAADGDSDTNDGGITGTIPSIEAVAGNSTIYNVGGGGWDSITGADIANIVAQVNAYANAENFAWYAHQNQWGVLEGISRALNGNTYLMQTGQRPIPQLFGYPVRFVNNAMPSAFAQDKIGLLFGDLSAMTATGSNGQVHVDSSQSFYFDQDVTALRAIQHIGVNVYQPGQNGTTGSIIAVRYTTS